MTVQEAEMVQEAWAKLEEVYLALDRSNTKMFSIDIGPLKDHADTVLDIHASIKAAV